MTSWRYLTLIDAIGLRRPRMVKDMCCTLLALKSAAEEPGVAARSTE